MASVLLHQKPNKDFIHICSIFLCEYSLVPLLESAEKLHGELRGWDSKNKKICIWAYIVLFFIIFWSEEAVKRIWEIREL